jgi:hypothetical protein
MKKCKDSEITKRRKGTISSGRITITRNTRKDS